MEQTLCFFGHRTINATEKLKDTLHNTVEYLITKKNVDTFIFGGYGDFDKLCHNIITSLKKEKYPHIIRILAYCDISWENPLKRPRYINFAEFDELKFIEPEFNYWYTRIYYRNCEIINQSDFVVSYIRNKENSGAYKAYKYAKQKKKEIIEI